MTCAHALAAAAWASPPTARQSTRPRASPRQLSKSTAEARSGERRCLPAEGSKAARRTQSSAKAGVSSGFLEEANAGLCLKYGPGSKDTLTAARSGEEEGRVAVVMNFSKEKDSRLSFGPLFFTPIGLPLHPCSLHSSWNAKWCLLVTDSLTLALVVMYKALIFFERSPYFLPFIEPTYPPIRPIPSSLPPSPLKLAM